MSSHAVGQDEDGEWETSLTVNPQQREKVDFTEIVLALIREYYDRRQYIATAYNSKYSAFNTLRNDLKFPRGLKGPELNTLLHKAEQDGLIEREEYEDHSRNKRERWR